MGSCHLPKRESWVRCDLKPPGHNLPRDRNLTEGPCARPVSAVAALVEVATRFLS